MRLERLHILKAPGLPGGLPPLDLPPGLTVVVGPNASGKSTVSRTLRALLWPGEAPLAASADARWRHDGEVIEARLFAGKVNWQEAPGFSIPRGAAPLARFGIKSLLEAEDQDDQSLARELAQELAGGFDLDAAAKTFSASDRYQKKSKEGRALQDAEKALRLAKRSTDALLREEQELARITEEIKEAEKAREEASAAELLIEFLEARARHGLLKAALAEYPEALGELVGNEDEEIADIEGSLVRARQELSAAKRKEAELEELRGKLARRALPRDEELVAWEERAGELLQLERDLRAAEASHREALETLASAKKRIGDEQRLLLEPVALEELGEAIRAWRAAKEELAGIKRSREILVPKAAEPTDDSIELEGALRALRDWLRAPGGAGSGRSALDARRIQSLRWVALVALALGMGGMALSLLGFLALTSAVAFLCLFAVGMLVLFFSRASTEVEPDVREEAVGAAKRAGLELSAWEVSAVRAKLTELEQLRDAKRLRERSVAQAEALERDVREAEQEAALRREALEARGRTAGIQPDWLDLGAALQVEALGALGSAMDAEAQAAARLASSSEQRQELLEAAAEWLHPLGVTAPGDAASLKAELRSLLKQSRDLAELESQTQQAARDSARLAREVGEAEARLDKLWQRTALAERSPAALKNLMQQREQFADARQELRDAAGKLAEAERRFEQVRGPELLVEAGLAETRAALLELTPEATQTWASGKKELAARLTELFNKQGGLQRSLEDAMTGHRLSDALSGVRAASEALGEKRERAAEDAIGRTLIRAAEEHHVADHTPRLLQRAREHFGRFTEEAWSIDLDRSGSFFALEVASGERRGLAELSDGTRVQLLLAARLAALELREEGCRMPICLDEALSTTDARRFRGAAKALFELAGDQDAPRQILYFTADHGEAEQWKLAARELGLKEPEVLDLGQLTDEPADWGGSLPPAPALPEPLPEPEGHTPASYARAVGAPTPDGFLAPTTWHLFTLAFDDLDALRLCLERRMTTLGVWRRARDAGELPASLDGQAIERLSARLELAEATARLWRIGRGRPVTWEDIQESGAVTKVFADRVRDVLKRHEREPLEFIEATRNIKRFKSQADKLEAHLIDCGVLPTEEPLEPDELVRRALAAAEPSVETLGSPQASAFVEWLTSLFSEAGARVFLKEA